MGFIEQGNVYNTFNFSWAYNWAGNTTAVNRLVASLLCPSTRLPSSTRTTWAAGVQQPTPPQITRDLPADSASLHDVIVHGLRDITDGSTNTIAMSEGLVGESTWTRTSLRRRRRGVGLEHEHVLVNPMTNYSGVLSALAACSVAMQQLALTPPPSTDTSSNKQRNWTLGLVSHGNFNTIVPPSSRQYYPGASGPRAAQPQRQQFECDERQQQPPGRGQLPVRRRQRQVPQESINMTTYWRWERGPTVR